MSKVTQAICVLFLASYVLAADDVSTDLKVVEPGQSILKLDGKKKSFPLTSLPYDDGTTNWGDQVFKKRQDGDALLLRDLVIYPSVSSKDLSLQYSATFNKQQSITSVRFINVGRQRAYCDDINIYSDSVEIDFVIPAGKDVRVFVEIYAS
ncbi:hypothetical protein HHI36_003221 [Cryptolaemus montrouzieri]|uniref:Uncharacterized protein n=1 Tax=Cryptolaemus montrouzieri TaxID=559131 RepID=A0ABD2PCU7_9CUCU